MIKVGIVGCGKIADAHVAAISLIAGSEIVGVVDKEEMMARQLCERFNIKRFYQDVQEMLDLARPDVVHITTPPQSHFHIGQICLNSGCHVYMEKPFTVNSQEANQLLRLAESKNLKVTVGTDEQYSHTAIEMRKLIHEGYLGGPPVHMEVYYCYDLGDERYARSFLGNKSHWVRSLPGQLLQNIISHGIAKIAEYLPGIDPLVIAHGFTSNFLKKIEDTDLVDELRVIIDDSGVTAYFTFSTQMRPLLREFRIYGPTNGLIISQDHHSLIKIPRTNYKSYLNSFVPLNNYAKQYRKNMLANTRLFLKRDFHMKSGLKRLIESFYGSISNNSPLPISYKEILLTTRIMDSIFAQVYRRP
ncbi:MAG: Gfo/Idh/MocA family oxidoreductase [Firmicutes bacterium]|nr:Gfo/Idh/MocA family oxidoreductase [Bacillota bacterium]